MKNVIRPKTCWGPMAHFGVHHLLDEAFGIFAHIEPFARVPIALGDTNAGDH